MKNEEIIIVDLVSIKILTRLSLHETLIIRYSDYIWADYKWRWGGSSLCYAGTKMVK